MATRSLNVAITGDARSLNRVLDQTEGRTKRWGGNMAKGMAVAGAAAGAAFAGGLTKAAQAAIESEKAQKSMEAQLKASGISFKNHGKEIDNVIQKVSKLSGLDDEDLQKSFTNIVRATGDVDKGLRLTGTAADLARAKHIDVAKAGEIVGKVAAGNTGILGRYGIKVKEGASAQEALALMQKKFSGQAEAYGKTTQGALDRAGVASENLGEKVGAKLTPMLAKGADALVDVVEAVQEHWPKIRKTVAGVVDRVRDAIGTVIAFVRRFRTRNAEDIEGVVSALRKVGRFFQNIFEDVIVPTVKKVLPPLRDAIGGIVRIIRGLIRVVTGIINGDWSKVWDGVKDIVSGALKGLRGVIRGSYELLKGVVIGLGKKLVGGLLDGLKGIGEAVFKGIKSGISAGIDKVKDWIDKANPLSSITGNLGDGIGRTLGKTAGDGLGFLGGSAGKSGAGLMGADFDLAPFARLGAGFGLRTTSGLRPGSVTSSGNTSYHSSGDAIDMSGPPGAMMRFFRTMKGTFGNRLRELIYTPGGAGIKDGRPFQYTGAVAADHYDHVHVAYTGPFGDGIGDIRNLWTRAGGRAAASNMAAAIAMAESSGDPRAFNRNTDGSVDRGLWQINSVHGSLSSFDRMRNAKAAVSISGNGRNWNPWVTFKTGAYRRFLRAGGGGTSGGGSGGGGGGASARARFEASQHQASSQSTSAISGSQIAGRPGVMGGPSNSFGYQGSWPHAEPTPWWEQPLPEKGEADTSEDTSAADAMRESIDANTRATEEHTAALKGVQDEMKRNNDIATSTLATDSYQLKKFVADMLSGEFGRGMVNRGMTAGTGVEVAF